MSNDAAQYPYAQDLDGAWHRRPEGDGWHAPDTAEDLQPQCATLCGQEIHSVHVSEYVPEADPVQGETLCPCVTDETLLAEMRRQYPYAELATHMLSGGLVRLRCHQCKIRPVPEAWQHVQWCDPCLDEATAGKTPGQ